VCVYYTQNNSLWPKVLWNDSEEPGCGLIRQDVELDHKKTWNPQGTQVEYESAVPRPEEHGRPLYRPISKARGPTGEASEHFITSDVETVIIGLRRFGNQHDSRAVTWRYGALPSVRLRHRHRGGRGSQRDLLGWMPKKELDWKTCRRCRDLRTTLVRGRPAGIGPRPHRGPTQGSFGRTVVYAGVTVQFFSIALAQFLKQKLHSQSS